MKNTLIVAEVFYSLQCEGKTIGTPAVFLRLGGCNLLCKSENWTCDTIEVWQKGKVTSFEDVINNSWVKRLAEGAHLVITGGEPLIHQEYICQYLNYFQNTHGFTPIIEVETNGTIVPNQFLKYVVKHWNVSPKLSNSGETWERRVKPIAIDTFNKLEGSIFKFVVKNEGDVLEIINEWMDGIDVNKIMLMPAGGSREELDAVRLEVAESAIRYGFLFTDRLHIVIWNQKTGV